MMIDSKHKFANFKFLFISVLDIHSHSSEYCCLTFLLLNTTYPVLANSVDPDQLAEAN